MDIVKSEIRHEADTLVVTVLVKGGVNDVAAYYLMFGRCTPYLGAPAHWKPFTRPTEDAVRDLAALEGMTARTGIKMTLREAEDTFGHPISNYRI